MKTICFIFLMLLLVACTPPNTSVPDGLEAPTFPRATSTPQVIATKTSPPTPTPLVCFHLTSPTNNSVLPSIGPVKFEWEGQGGAKFYILTFIYPNGLIVDFKTPETSLTRYIETMPIGGIYKWVVTAYAPNESKICNSDTSTFSKPEYEKKKKKTPIAPPIAPPTPP